MQIGGWNAYDRLQDAHRRPDFPKAIHLDFCVANVPVFSSGLVKGITAEVPFFLQDSGQMQCLVGGYLGRLFEPTDLISTQSNSRAMLSPGIHENSA